MLLRDLGQRTRNSLLEFVWKQWTELGVAGSSVPSENRIIDPEALLLFTMEVGRYDPRLFDEVIDWVVRNERWLSLQRLKNMAEDWEIDTSRRAIIALARLINSLEKRHRWRTLSQIEIPPISEPGIFFLGINGDPIPTFGQQDRFFAEVGLIRPPILTRGLSLRVPMNSKAALVLKLRSLFGLGPRSEVVAYLLTHDGANVSAIARSTGYSRPPVQETLNDLAEGGFVLVSQRRNQRLYSIDTLRWGHLLDIGESSPDWVEWTRIFRALGGLLAFFAEAESKDLSDYMLRSALLTLNQRMRDELAETGLHTPFARPLDLTEVLEEFERRIDILIADLNR